MDSEKTWQPSRGHVLAGYFGPARSAELVDSEKTCRVLRVAMPTTNWEERKQSLHYYYYSLERFFLSQRLDDLQSILVLLLLNHSAD